MMARSVPRDSKPEPGEMVLLKSIPPGLVDGLPQDDQNAIVAIIGKPVLLVGYDDDGRAELHFDDPFDGRAEPFRRALPRGFPTFRF